jgi:SNF2 family DNA or RNA helicase
VTASVTEKTPSSAWPEGALYYSPKSYPFQIDHIAKAYLGMFGGNQPEWMFAWDTGLGKSHAAMRLSALAFEDDLTDLVVLVCEKNKLKEWKADFDSFTRLSSRIHHGPSRKNKFAKEGLPDVLITTYETGKADLATVTKTGRRGKTVTAGYVLDELTAAGRTPMVIFDEADKLSNRSSATYRAYEYILKTLRKRIPDLPVIMMTATSVRRDYENTFNQLRLLRPEAMPLIKEFEAYFVRGRDIYGKARYWDHRTEEFAAICQPLMLPKRKTDADVVAQFPAMTEEALWVDLEGAQKDAYKLVAEMAGAPGAMTALRQLCAHPRALVHSAEHGTSKLARELVEVYGREYLWSLPSAKTERLVEYLAPVVREQQAKAVVFTFFGPSVIPHLSEALQARGMRCFTFDELEEFKAHTGGAVLLSSDAGARGVNIPEASYLVEYDMATTYGLRTQRLNRVSRLGQGGPTVTVRSMLARETIEVPLMYSMLRGNVQSDELLGGETGEQYMTAAMRKAMLTEEME